MTVTYDMFEIDKQVTTISFSDDYGYYISEKDVKDLIKDNVNAKEYDHIFIAYKLGESLHKEKIKTGDWIGLGGIVYEKDIGFSNIRVPNENSTLLYKYSSTNKFPEEVFIHEFLHGLERIEEEYGNEVISLHANEEYGYKEDDENGLKEWYRAYLQSKVSDSSLGLSKEVFTRKPVHESDFIEKIDLTNNYFEEPENLKEEIISIINELKKYINKTEYSNLEE